MPYKFNPITGQFDLVSPPGSGGGGGDFYLGEHVISELEDVNTVTPNVGDVLKWDGANWVNVPTGGAGVTSLNALDGALTIEGTNIGAGDALYNQATNVDTSISFEFKGIKSPDSSVTVTADTTDVLLSVNAIKSDTLQRIETFTQADYDAIETKEPTALYIITDAISGRIYLGDVLIFGI